MNEGIEAEECKFPIVDHGAPWISAAQAEFQEAAKHWQQRAAEAAANAAKYTDLARNCLG